MHEDPCQPVGKNFATKNSNDSISGQIPMSINVRPVADLMTLGRSNLACEYSAFWVIRQQISDLFGGDEL